MSFLDAVKRCESLINQRNNVISMIWLQSETEVAQLSAEQLESKYTIYTYLEI